MSKKRYRVQRNAISKLYICDTQTGKDVGGKQIYMDEANAIADLLNKQADELREAQAEAASLRETLIATHQWIGGSVGNEPFEVQGSGKAWSAIIRVLENTTAGADLLAELEQLQGYRAFVHSCIKSGEVCVYTFEEYLEKMKSE